MEQLTFDLPAADSAPAETRQKRGSGARWRIDDDGRECARCGNYKLWDEFTLSPTSPRGRFSYCKPCKHEVAQQRYRANPEKVNAQARTRRQIDGERIRARDRAAYHRNPEAERVSRRENYARNAESRREAARAYRKANPEKVAAQQLRIAARRCGQDPDVIVAHFLSHNGLCDICGKPPGASHRRHGRLTIDHDHETGEFRGLLCSTCNLALGLFGDDPKILTSAIAYLGRTRRQAAA